LEKRSEPLSPLRIATTITASLHLATRKRLTENTSRKINKYKKQLKVDKTSDLPIIDLVIMVIREMTSHHTVESDFQKFPVIFPVLRENGISIGAASLRMIGGEGAFMPRYHIHDTITGRGDNHGSVLPPASAGYI
jgi:hypothetical protein